jgi:hypothetical protein
VPGYPDLFVMALLTSGGLVAAVWLVGTQPSGSSLSVAMIVGGVLGSAPGALAGVWRPVFASWGTRAPATALWLWRACVLVGPLVAGQLSLVLAGNILGVGLPATQPDRILLGFAAAAIAWRYLMQPHGARRPTVIFPQAHVDRPR